MYEATAVGSAAGESLRPLPSTRSVHHCLHLGDGFGQVQTLGAHLEQFMMVWHRYSFLASFTLSSRSSVYWSLESMIHRYACISTAGPGTGRCLPVAWARRGQHAHGMHSYNPSLRPVLCSGSSQRPSGLPCSFTLRWARDLYCAKIGHVHHQITHHEHVRQGSDLLRRPTVHLAGTPECWRGCSRPRTRRCPRRKRRSEELSCSSFILKSTSASSARRVGVHLRDRGKDRSGSGSVTVGSRLGAVVPFVVE